MKKRCYVGANLMYVGGKENYFVFALIGLGTAP